MNVTMSVVWYVPVTVAMKTPAGTVEVTLPLWVKVCEGTPVKSTEEVDSVNVGRVPVPLTVAAKSRVAVFVVSNPF